jgi:cyanophycinase
MKYPKGLLVAIRENILEVAAPKEKRSEAELREEQLLAPVVNYLKGKNPLIELVTTESSAEEDILKRYKRSLKKLGYNHVNHLHLPGRDAANDKKNLLRLEQCHAVVFVCKDPLKLCSVLGGTSTIKLLKERYYQESIIVAGVQAGASCLSDLTINDGEASKSYLKGEVNVSLGLGFLNNILIDTNFDTTGRFGSVIQAIAEQPGKIYIGLSEGTGIVVEKGSKLKVIGSNCIMIIDGSQTHHNNIASIKGGMPISMGNLIVHMLSQHDVFDIEEREYTQMEMEMES